MKARSPPASLAFIGQVTKHITVKWSICLFNQEKKWHPAQ